ncbi:hypothetical protein DJ010_03415 [Nocardioides silvaticus]|uniref:Methyltransferase type 11 domain-containing protein n=1 Tax=Nocardioides silvaticus TaxID=2201891 RepID=A0A316TM10_9ACTN|nr:class I SAM-dependent methyltransferase [Nocardioides silvaticus]PWN04681.1 hypothetical protein DJ010_03415 [Nocardioides silvaticus]
MDDIGAAYDAAAALWRTGPERMYARLSEAMADHAPVDLEGARVLDAGAGTEVAGEALRRRGAGSVVAVDLAHGMLPRPPALSAVGDLTRLPFPDRAFDLAAAGFSLNHFEDPMAAMVELRRVAGALLATVFAPEWDHPCKEAIEAVLARDGFEPPAWYRTFKAGSTWELGAAGLEQFARAAGYDRAEARIADVATGMDTPADLVDWRFGMAHTAPYVAALPPDVRARVRREAEEAVAGLPPLVVSMVVLAAA